MRAVNIIAPIVIIIFVGVLVTLAIVLTLFLRFVCVRPRCPHLCLQTHAGMDRAPLAVPSLSPHLVSPHLISSHLADQGASSLHLRQPQQGRARACRPPQELQGPYPSCLFVSPLTWCRPTAPQRYGCGMCMMHVSHVACAVCAHRRVLCVILCGCACCVISSARPPPCPPQRSCGSC